MGLDDEDTLHGVIFFGIKGHEPHIFPSAGVHLGHPAA